MNPDSSIVPMHAGFDSKRYLISQDIEKVMTLKRATIFVSGNVQMAGFRTFVKNIADSIDVKGYAENLSDGRVKIVCEGEEMGIAELANAIRTKASALSKVESLQTEYEKYAGEFLDFERRGEDVPRRATLDDLLNVMKSFDNKAEKIVGILGEIGQNTSQIPPMREDISEIKSYTSQIPAMREDIASIKTDTREIAAKLWEKYEEMSKEIAQMKITLTKIEAKVFS